MNSVFMSESTEELRAAVWGIAMVAAEAESLAERLVSHARKFTEDAANHGWHAMAMRMREAAEALESAAAQVRAGKEACESAARELGLIDTKIPADEIVTRLTTGTLQLGEATTALQQAIERAEDAQSAVGEISQEGMMQATSDLHNQLTEVHELLTRNLGMSEGERVAADTYAKKHLGKFHRVAANAPRHHPMIQHHPWKLFLTRPGNQIRTTNRRPGSAVPQYTQGLIISKAMGSNENGPQKPTLRFGQILMISR
jgi:hypothetical protein